MSDIPIVTGEAAISAFSKAGFSVCRVKGSHHIMKKEGCRSRLSIPVHAGKTLGKGLLRSQIRAAGLTTEQFRELL